MKFTKTALAATISLAILTAPALAGEVKGSHVHMGHVATGWKDTPDNMGFLPTAMAEAKIAMEHAGYAAGNPDDLKSMKLHVGHVLHTIQPDLVEGGPGLGYGLQKAAEGAVKHVTFAMETDDASENVKTHGVHVASAAGNAAAWAGQIIALAAVVNKAETAEDATEAVQKINTLAGYIVNGHDANGDGNITWEEGEGGLKIADKHMTFMLKGEDLTRESLAEKLSS